MAQSTYDILFDGILTEGADLSQTKGNIAQLFKTEIQKIEFMFAGKRVIIKRNLDQQTAQKYQAVLKQAGIICEIAEKKPEGTITEDTQRYSADNPPPIPAPGSPIRAQTVTGDNLDSVTIAPAGETIVEHKQIARPTIDVSTYSVDSSGEDLVKHHKIAEPEFDISGISLGETGADLAEHKKVPQPDIDISNISLKEH